MRKESATDEQSWKCFKPAKTAMHGTFNAHMLKEGRSEWNAYIHFIPLVCVCVCACLAVVSSPICCIFGMLSLFLNI